MAFLLLVTAFIGSFLSVPTYADLKSEVAKMVAYEKVRKTDREDNKIKPIDKGYCQQMFESDLFGVGPKKILGYLPLKTVLACKEFIHSEFGGFDGLLNRLHTATQGEIFVNTHFGNPKLFVYEKAKFEELLQDPLFKEMLANLTLEKRWIDPEFEGPVHHLAGDLKIHPKPEDFLKFLDLVTFPPSHPMTGFIGYLFGFHGHTFDKLQTELKSGVCKSQRTSAKIFDSILGVIDSLPLTTDQKRELKEIATHERN